MFHLWWQNEIKNISHWFAQPIMRVFITLFERSGGRGTSSWSPHNKAVTPYSGVAPAPDRDNLSSQAGAGALPFRMMIATLFEPRLEAPLFPCSSIDWTTLYCWGTSKYHN